MAGGTGRLEVDSDGGGRVRRLGYGVVRIDVGTAGGRVLEADKSSAIIAL